MKAIADAPRKDLITFRGRENHGEPCEALAHHGFNGIEADVVHAISRWITK